MANPHIWHCCIYDSCHDSGYKWHNMLRLCQGIIRCYNLAHSLLLHPSPIRLMIPFNSVAPGRYGWNFKQNVILKSIISVFILYSINKAPRIFECGLCWLVWSDSRTQIVNYTGRYQGICWHVNDHGWRLLRNVFRSVIFPVFRTNKH